MDWSRAKNLLILLLVCINLYLGVNIYAQIGSAQREERSAAENACALLEEKGLQVDREQLMSMPDSIRSFVFSRSIDSEEQAARRLLGDCTAEAVGGGIYTYIGEKGSLIFRSGGYLEVELADGMADIEPLLQVQNEDYRLEMTREGEEYRLTMDGLPVVGAGVRSSQGGIWTGSWAFTYALQAGGESMSRARLILILGEMLEKRELDRLDGIDCVYVLTSQQKGELSLTPAWQLVGGGQRWYISTLTGQEITPV